MRWSDGGGGETKLRGIEKIEVEPEVVEKVVDMFLK